MTNADPRTRMGATAGDVLVMLAMLSLGASLLYPITRQRAFEDRVDAVVADVESLRSEAERLRDEAGSWPGSVPSGEAPGGANPSVVSMVREGYILQWSRWLSVELPQPDTSAVAVPVDEENPPPPPPLPQPIVSTTGGITVHTSEDALLAELLRRYGSGASFVRDTSWTLVLPRSGAPAGLSPVG